MRVHRLEMSAEQVEELEAMEVEDVLSGWDVALTPQENLIAMADMEEELPYNMDSDVYSWLQRGVRRRVQRMG